jgi:hypothetical protein
LNLLANYFNLVEVEQERRATHFTKYLTYLWGGANQHYTELAHRLRLLFCVIYGTTINPSKNAKEAVLEMSCDLIHVRVIYLSQMNTDELIKLFDDKLNNGQLPTNVDYLRLAYLPELNQIRRDPRYPNVEEDESQTIVKALDDLAFKDLLIVTKYGEKTKSFCEKLANDFLELLITLYLWRLSKEQAAYYTQEVKAVEDFITNLRMEAKEEKMVEIALKLIHAGIPREIILKVTGITEERLKTLEETSTN